MGSVEVEWAVGAHKADGGGCYWVLRGLADCLGDINIIVIRVTQAEVVNRKRIE